MKRILPFVLVFAVLLSTMIVPMPVQATSGSSVNILDFCSLNTNGTNYMYFTNSGSASFNIGSTLGNIRSYRFDILLQITGKTPDSFSVSHNSQVYFDTTVTDLGSDLIRLTGNFNGYVIQKFVIDMTSAGNTYVTFISFNVSMVSDNRVDLTTTLNAVGGDQADLSAGGIAVVSPSSDLTSASYWFYLPYDVWSNYDYIDVSGYCYGDITAITCNTVDDAYVPVYTSYLEYNSARSSCYFSVRLDLTDGNLATSGNIAFWVNANIVAGSGDFGLWGLSGVIIGDPLDPVVTWLRILDSDILAVYKVMTSYFPTFSQTLTNIKSGITSLSSNIDSEFAALTTALKSYFDALNDNIDSEFTSLKTKLETEFTSLKTKLGTEFTNLKSKIETEFTNLKTALSTHFSTLNTNLKTWFTNLQSAISTRLDTMIGQLQELIDGKPVDEEVTDNMQQSEDDLGNMTDQMEQGTPDISVDDVNISTGAIPDDGSSDLAFRFFDIFWSSSFLLSMITTVVAISTISFVFFGKR